MLAFIIMRILQAVPVLLAVGFISFAMFAYVGDPLLIMLPQDFTAAQREVLVHALGLDQPMIVQYGRFIWAALHGFATLRQAIPAFPWPPADDYVERMAELYLAS